MCMFASIKKYLFICLLGLSLAGCASYPLPRIVIPPTKAEQQLTELNKQHEIKNAELEKKNADYAKQITDLEASFKVKFESNLSLGAANLMAAYDTLMADPVKDKYFQAALPALDVAITAFPKPTIQDYQVSLATQRKLLSDQATEIAKGKEEIANAKAQATQTKADLDKITADKKIVEQEKAEIAAAKSAEAESFGKETTRLAGEVSKETRAAAELRAEQDAQKIKNAESRKGLEKIVVIILMIVGIGAGVISFTMKGPLQLFNPGAAIVSAACIGLAITISFLPLAWLIAALAFVFAIIVTVVILEWKKEKTTANGLAGAQAEYLEANPASTLASHIEEWVGKGSSTAKLIEDKVKELNVK